MHNTAARWFGRSSLVVVTALVAACSDGSPLAPIATTSARQAARADVTDGNRFPDLTGCEHLAAPVGSTLLLRAYGIGVQIYRWNGSAWIFVAPSATIFADADGHGKVADHFGGPTWQALSGGKVVGTVTDRCQPDLASIPWLSLSAIADGPGVFHDVNFIQRLRTVGGNAPSTPGAAAGDIVEVPYTADYLFYRAPSLVE